MNVYVRGITPESTTNAAAIITVELCDQTDMKGIECHNGLFHNPFYRELKVNCGKVIEITDLKGEKSFDCAQIHWVPSDAEIAGMTLHKGKYFYVHGYDPSKSIDIGILHVGRYITAYSHKAAVVEKSGYVDPDYTGTAYRHHPNGLIKEKVYYKKGKRRAVYKYRDDAFNTLKEVNMFNQSESIPECTYEYNEREALTKETWYTSKGSVHSTVCAKEPEPELPPLPIKRPPRPSGLPRPRSLPLPRPRPEPELPPPIPETPLPDSDSESGQTGSSDDMEPPEKPDGQDGSGGSGGGRVKPRPPQDEDSASEADC